MRVICEQCGKPFEGKNRSARLCGATCRKRSSRAIAAVPVEQIPAPVTPEEPSGPREHPLIAQTRRELDAAGKLDSVVGQLAVELAEKVCSGFDTGSAKAAVSKEFRAVMAEALADVAKKADSLDELAQRRLSKASGA